MGKQWKQCQTILGGSKISANGDCSHEIKRHLLLGRKSYDQPRQHVKKQRHYFVNKGPSHQGYILSPCLFNFYAKYIMRNTGPEEAQAGIKIAGRNINKLRYTDDTTLMAEK